MDDFNDISHSREKFGGRRLSLQKMTSFNNFLNCCNLVDLGFVGPRFTWTNNRESGKIVRTRIDRCHANTSWIILFPNSSISHLPRVYFDHFPILLNVFPSCSQKITFFALKPFG